MLCGEVSILLDQLAAHDEQYAPVDLHELDLFAVELADLLDLARRRVTVWVRGQARQEDSFACACQLNMQRFKIKCNVFETSSFYLQAT